MLTYASSVTAPISFPVWVVPSSCGGSEARGIDRRRYGTQEKRFYRKPMREQLEDAISAWCTRFRRQNASYIERQIRRQGVGRDLTEASLSHRQVIEAPATRAWS